LIGDFLGYREYAPQRNSWRSIVYPRIQLTLTDRHRRNKVHHLDQNTDEDMVPVFPQDVDGKPLNNKHLLPRRNWCGMQVAPSGETPFELDVVLNVEVSCKDPSGRTKGYGIRVPILTV
jgi:hypothetical protein